MTAVRIEGTEDLYTQLTKALAEDKPDVIMMGGPGTNDIDFGYSAQAVLDAMGEDFPVWPIPAPLFDTYDSKAGGARGWHDPFSLSIEGHALAISAGDIDLAISDAIGEKIIVKLIGHGAPDRATAIRWLHDAEGTDNDNEYLCFCLGLKYGYFNCP